MNNCEKGYPNEKGMCCCNCVHQLALRKHPSNKGDFKGSILENTGLFACAVLGKMDGTRIAIIQNSEHGVCEEFRSVKIQK